MTETNIDILGIHEHRIVHEETHNYEYHNKNLLITSSAWRNEVGAAIGGVGIMLGQRSRKSFLNVKSVSNRILIANFKGTPATTVITVYSPTNVEKEEVVDKFYDDLREAIKTVPAHNVTLIIGDLNARVGKDDGKFPYHAETNRNGEKLVDFAQETNLVICNTIFQKRLSKLWTYLSPKGEKYQLDYILVKKKWRNSVKNAEAYSSFASIGSDHRCVSAKLRLSLRANRAPDMTKIRYDWKCLSNNTEMQERYTVTVKNKFHTLSESDDDDPTQRYSKFIQANEETAKELLPKLKATPKIHRCEDKRVQTARGKIDDAVKHYNEKPSITSRLKLKTLRGNLYDNYNKVLEEEISSKIDEIENAQNENRYKLSWKLVNEISGRKSSKKGQLEGDTKEDRVKNWYNHFSNLLGKPPATEENVEIDKVFDNLAIDDGPFTIEEFHKAKKTISEGKACGEDRITPEVIKRCQLDEEFLDFCNQALMEQKKPHQWSVMNIIPIPKSGDLSKGGNYRGISLCSLVAKTYNKMILNRIRPAIDPLLRINQNGFRPGRTTTSQILALRRIIEGVKDMNIPAVITFIDFKKAFDTINRTKLMKILTAYGIPERIVKAIEITYTDTKAKVISPDGETNLFDITTGVLQGDTLAPYLFIIALDFALREALSGREEELGFHLKKRRSRRVGPICITDLDFADDIALISEQIEQALNMLNRVETFAANVGLLANAKKTKVMAFNQKEDVEIKTSDGTKLEVIDEFTYLGSLMSSSIADIKRRIALAWTACNKMYKIWKSSLSTNFKERLFISTVESVVLHSCEAWTLSEKLERKINGSYTRLLRAALGYSWKDKVTNETL